MEHVVYFLVSIAATTAGSVSGMGGGVIIKPALDLIGQYGVKTIGVLSSITVLIMALVAVGKNVAQKTISLPATTVPIAVGATVGGILGERLLNKIVASTNMNAVVVAIQNSCLCFLIAGVFLYMLKREKIAGFRLEGMLPSTLAGLFMGFVASFLGIGGGPINVAVLMLAFSFDIKTAAGCSLVAILFAQASKLGLILIEGGFAQHDLSMLPVMVVGAVSGGVVGSMLNKRLSEKGIQFVFNSVQLIVFLFCVVNIVRALATG